MSGEDKFDLDERNEEKDSKARLDDDDRYDDLEDHSSSCSSSSRNDVDDDDSNNSSSSRRRGRSRRGRDDASSVGRSQDDPIIGSNGTSSSRRGYMFELENDIVTNLRRVKKNGRIKRERIEAGESWVFNKETGELLHSEIYANGTEVSIYTGTTVGELFTRVSESFVPFGVDSTTLSI